MTSTHLMVCCWPCNAGGCDEMTFVRSVVFVFGIAPVRIPTSKRIPESPRHVVGPRVAPRRLAAPRWTRTAVRPLSSATRWTTRVCPDRRSLGFGTLPRQDTAAAPRGDGAQAVGRTLVQDGPRPLLGRSPDATETAVRLARRAVAVVCGAVVGGVGTGGGSGCPSDGHRCGSRSCSRRPQHSNNRKKLWREYHRLIDFPLFLSLLLFVSAEQTATKTMNRPAGAWSPDRRFTQSAIAAQNNGSIANKWAGGHKVWDRVQRASTDRRHCFFLY